MRLPLCFLALIAVTWVAQADPRLWDPAGVPVSLGGRVEWGQSVAANAAGAAVTVWSDKHSGNREVYGQMIDAAGQRVWGDGVPLTNDPYEQSQAVVTATEGGWIVAWVDYRTAPRGVETTPGGAVWFQKLDNAGIALWTAGGIPVPGSEQVARNSLRVFSDNAGGGVLAWIGYPENRRTITVVRVGNTGAVIWEPLRVTSTLGQYTEFATASDDAGGILLAWSTQNAIEACRVNAAGELPWGTLEVASPMSGWFEPVICSDHSSGAFVSWYAGSGSELNIYAQHVDAIGRVQWSAEGVAVCNAPNEQYDLSAVTSTDQGVTDGLILAWYDHRDVSRTDIYFTQKLDINGAPLWGENGILLADTMMAFQRHLLISDNQGGFLATWEDLRRSYQNVSYAGYDIRATRFNASGQHVWAGGIAGVCLATEDQWIPTIVPQGNHSLIVFQNGQSARDVQGLSYQILDNTTGQAVLAQDGVTLVHRPSTEVSSAQAAPMSDGRTAIFWSSQQVHYQILNSQGQPTLNADTAVILADSNLWSCGLSQVCPDGSGGVFIVMYTGDSEYGYTAFLAHMAADGHLTGNGRGRIIFSGPPGDYSVEPPIVSADCTGGCFVAFSHYQSPIQESSVMRFTSDCQWAWPVPVLLNNQMNISPDLAKIVTAADGSCMISYMDYTGISRARVARISDDGAVLWNTLVSDTTMRGDYPKLALDAEGGVYCTWLQSDSGSDVNYRVLAQHIEPDGHLRWNRAGIQVGFIEGRGTQSRPVCDNAGNLIVVWVNQETVNYTRQLRAQKLSPNAQRLWSNDGVVVCDNDGSPGNPAVVSDGAAGAFVVWQNYTAYGDHVGATHLQADGSSGPDPFWTPNVGAAISDTLAISYDAPLLIPGVAESAVALWPQDIQQSEEGAMDFFAQRIVAGAVNVDGNAVPLPQRIELLQNYPNPFNPSTEISFVLPKAGRLELRVFDVLGREVVTLADEVRNAGAHTMTWDGRSASGAPVASGVYLYQLKAGDVTAARKMMLIR